MAIDGVAPRAKMNQQRARRFRAAKDAAEAAAEEEQLRQEFEREGKKLPPRVDSQVFDSNVITPGTEFMSTLSFALRYYIHIRLNSDPGWKNIKVILSDANVPGEGEHKIMSYIRCNKNHPGYNPNTHHCLYGLDADLIMLSLATHEIHFSILREVVFFPGEQDKCFLCGQMGHRAADCEGKMKRKAGEMLDNTEPDVAVKKPYEFVNIWILREYLEHDMQKPSKRSKKNLDRLIDDFIFICFFVGNDFLPHMPTLDIREGAIELLMSVYRSHFSSAKKYLTDASKLNLSNVERFIQAVGMYENKIFLKRALVHQRQSERFCRDKARDSAQASRQFSGKLVQLDAVDEVSDLLHSSPPKKYLRLSLDDNTGVTNVETENSIKTEELDNREDLKFKLKKLLRNKADVFSSGNGEQDKVRLGVSGWRERYYEEKFTAKSVEEMEQIRRDVVLKYTEGLCWIMHYYYHGVCSWKWFYPYHYAPFASDLKGLDRLDIKFELGSPFKPFNQLLSVLPSASAHALPECYRTLMTDPESAIADFYPADFEIDMNGKRYSWQGIAKLPFVDERRLLETIALVEKSLTTEEIRRNSVLFDMLFVVASHPLAELIRSLNSHTNNLSSEERATIMEKIDPALSDGMNGYVASCGGDSQPPCFSSPVEGMEDVLANQVICAIYKLPEDIRGSEITHQIPSLVIPKKTINLVDLKGESLLWHEDGDKRRAPARIMKTKRYNPEGSISGDRLGKAAHRLVLQTINAQPDNAHINTEPALCPNTVFQNQRASEKIPAFQENKIQWVSPQSQITPKKMKSPQSQNTWKKKRSSKRLEDLKKKNPLSVIPLKMKKSKNPRGKKENQIPQTKPTKKQKKRAIHLRMVEETRKRKEQQKIKIAKKAQMVPNTLELRSKTLPRSSSTI
ncbi:PREDICTED: 5'-3' exoribonuclease 2-like isoform X2 [Camelina sativa]|nr:PREDICTED: 5'-3' exoribonuclease 2-like isoform X2 [Camelina sativa]